MKSDRYSFERLPAGHRAQARGKGRTLLGCMLAVSALVMTLSNPVDARGIKDQMDMKVMKSDRAVSDLLQDITRAGDKLIAVGIYGHVLISDDNGATWTQSLEVPSITNLVAISCPTETKCWAVGHDQLIIHSRDAGATWEAQFQNADPSDTDNWGANPLMGVHFFNDAEGWAVGAFGLVYKTTNGGKSWARVTLPNLDPEREEWDPLIFDKHINAIIGTEAGELYVAGEGGTVYRSPDRGNSWEALVTPYTGSYFGLEVTRDDEIFAFGMRGNLFSSKDKGKNWVRVDSQTKESLLGSYYDKKDDTLLIVGTKGVVLYSGDGGERFDMRLRPNRVDMLGAVATEDGKIAIVGFGGAELLKSNGAAIKNEAL